MSLLGENEEVDDHDKWNGDLISQNNCRGQNPEDPTSANFIYGTTYKVCVGQLPRRPSHGAVGIGQPGGESSSNSWMY